MYVFFKDCRIVHTCGLYEKICEIEDLKNHPCLGGYKTYYIDENTLYFFPVLGKSTLLFIVF